MTAFAAPWWAAAGSAPWLAAPLPPARVRELTAALAGVRLSAATLLARDLPALARGERGSAAGTSWYEVGGITRQSIVLVPRVASRKFSINLATGTTTWKFPSDVINALHPEQHRLLLALVGGRAPEAR